MKKLLTTLCVTFTFISLTAQSDLFEVGAFLGGSAIGGDLVKSDLGSVNEVRLAYGIKARRYVDKNIAVRLSVIRTKLMSQAQQFDNFGSMTLRSETSLLEISADGEYDILGHQRNWLTKKGGVSPYVFLGVGVALTNPRLFYTMSNENIIADENADISKTRVVVPFGAGARWSFDKNGTLVFELGARPTFSDYLDGVSIAGNPKKNDWYGFFGLEYWYRISGQ